MVTAKATAAGGAPTSALAVESESKHGSMGGRDYADFFRHSLPSAVKHLTSQPCNMPMNTEDEHETGERELFLGERWTSAPASAPLGASFGTPCPC